MSSDAADQVVKIVLDGTEVALRITGSALKEISAMLIAALNTGGKKKGKSRLVSMLKSGPTEVFSLNPSDLKTFVSEAKKYGIKYCLVQKGGKGADGLCDIIARQEDAPRVNRLVERFGLGAVSRASVEAEVASATDMGKGGPTGAVATLRGKGRREKAGRPDRREARRRKRDRFARSGAAFGGQGGAPAPNVPGGPAMNAPQTSGPHVANAAMPWADPAYDRDSRLIVDPFAGSPRTGWLNQPLDRAPFTDPDNVWQEVTYRIEIPPPVSVQPPGRAMAGKEGRAAPPGIINAPVSSAGPEARTSPFGIGAPPAVPAAAPGVIGGGAPLAGGGASPKGPPPIGSRPEPSSATNTGAQGRPSSGARNHYASEIAAILEADEDAARDGVYTRQPAVKPEASAPPVSPASAGPQGRQTSGYRRAAKKPSVSKELHSIRVDQRAASSRARIANLGKHAAKLVPKDQKGR